MKRRGVTLVILDGIHISVEDIRAARHETRDVGGALHEVVVVRIDTGYHVRAELLARHVGERLPLSLAERIVRRQHHFEAIVLRFNLSQQLAPEKHIVVALDVRINLLPLPLRLQAVGGFEVTRRQVFRKSFGHKRGV